MKSQTILILILFCLVSTAVADPAGLVVVNEGKQVKAFSNVYEFTQFSTFKLTSVATYKLTQVDGKTMGGFAGHIQAVIEYPSETADSLVPGEAVYNLRTTFEAMQQISATYEKSRPYLAPWITKIGTILKRVKPDDVRYRGVWMSPKEYENLKTKAVQDEVPELIIGGRKLTRVKVKGIVGNEVTLEQSAGMLRVKIEDLPYTALRQLAQVSAIFRDNSQVRDWYGQFLEQLKLGGKVYQGVRFLSLSGDELTLATDSGQEVVSFKSLTPDELLVLAPKAPAVRERLDAAQAQGRRQVQAENDYRAGLAAERDKKWEEARSLYEKSTAAGHSLAGVNLGALYLGGEGGLKDESRASGLFTEAAKKGDGIAAYNLGLIRFLRLQKGITDAECLAYLEQAAFNQISEADYLIGIMHANGWGVAKDLDKSRRYLEKAKSKGVVEAVDALRIVEERMIPLAR
jgi:hypothetical protein